MAIKDDYIGKYCIVRSRDQGVMAGFVLDIDGRSVKVDRARQLYTWSSSFVLIELAAKGPRSTSEQRYSVESCAPVLMLEACGIIPCSPQAEAAIIAVEAEAHE